MQFDLLQKEILSHIDFDDNSRSVEIETPELVCYLTSINADIAELALGKIGKNLIDFVNKIDVQHPDLRYAVEQVFQNDAVLRQQVQEVLELADRCRNLSAISTNFHKLVDRAKISKQHLEDRCTARLFKSNKERTAVRKQKTIQIVDIQNICNKGIEFWNRQPNNFVPFNRDSIAYLKDIEDYEDRIDKYFEVGCSEIINKLQNEVRQLRIAFNDRYYGFNRITLSRASLILAKMHGCRFKVSWDIHDNKTNSVVTSRSEPYQPQAFPLHEVIHTASEDMLRLTEHLDSFPDINNKALFDNFIVLTPGGKDIQPVLLGERDNKCYFIAYWR